ncbi:MAG: hypothetical protein ACTSU0_03305 [Alphaproteobacteria bacterium]
MLRAQTFMIALLGALVCGPAVAQSSRTVPTETITMPEGERAMPEIPVSAATLNETASATPTGDVPEVHYDPAILPEPVRRLREAIIAAAMTGNPENLRPIIAASNAPPAFSFGHVEDPIAYLTSLSGDAEGREMMAILIEVLEAGFVHVDVGTDEEEYVWPYFARYPVAALTPQQIVELFKLVYAGDYEDMLAYGYYLSYRLGIAPDGTWRYFIAGD